jgi:IS30 family transposase
MAGHLTLEEREVIAQRDAAGDSRQMIAERIGRDKGTISRELRRNRSPNGYFPSKAQEKARQRRRERPIVRKMQRPDVRRYVTDGLRTFWSPDQIAGRSKQDSARDRTRQISRQTIYTWIHAQANRGAKWTGYLRRRGKRPRRPDNRGTLADTTSIAGRPQVVDRRSRVGDWEGDTVHGTPGRGGLLTLVERRTRYLLMRQVGNLRAATVRHAAVDAFRSVPRQARKTVTFDNGKEFAEHEQLDQQTGIRSYFARPYAAWQRGSNENTNGLTRQFFPKGTDLARQSASRINQVQDLLNHRPRRCLGYRTPHEAFHAASARCN